MPAVFTGLQAPSLLKIKSVRVVTTLIVHKSLVCVMLRCWEFEFSNVSSQPLQVNSKFCCNEMNLLVVVLRQKTKQSNKTSTRPAKKSQTNQESNRTKNTKPHNIKYHKSKMTDTRIVWKWEEGRMAAWCFSWPRRSRNWYCKNKQYTWLVQLSSLEQLPFCV